MALAITNRALLRGMLAGALVLAGTTACSRSDRTETGSDNTGAVVPDTMSGTVTQPGTSDTVVGIQSDTARATADPTAPGMETAATPRQDGEDTIGTASDEEAAGYRGMEPDSSIRPTDTGDTVTVSRDTASIGISGDTASTDAYADTPNTTSVEMEGAAAAADDSVGADWAADTAAGHAEMARDTSTTQEQTGAPAPAEAQRVAVDTTTGMDADVTAEGELAVEQSDTAVVVGDTAHIARTGERLEPVAAEAEGNDTLTVVSQDEPVRPPEDSTEIYGNVTGEADPDSDEEIEAGAEEVGAAAISGNITGAEAVGLMTRQGAHCIVVDPEADEEIRWDMSSTPVTLNPCGLGSMTLSKVWTER
ncbi:MAG: hypothetical protein ACREMZ_14230 [Gemmatimonadales bacterium]